MNRREALRILATGTALQLAPLNLLAALRDARAMLGTQAATRTLNPHQDATVKAITEMMIPRTETPGAADVGASDFIDLMLTEWYDEPDRARFLNGLAEMDARTQSLFGKDFVSCSADQQAEMLTELGEKMVEEMERQKAPHDVEVPKAESFYPMLRRLTLTAYYTSEAGATQELHFQIIPDRHDMCAAENDSGGA